MKRFASARHLILLPVATAAFALCASPAYADIPRNLQVSPAVIDEKAKARDIIKETLTLTNTGARTLNLFPSVEDVNPDNGEQHFSYAGNADSRSDSLANWIELSRGTISLAAGESKTVPFVIHVNMNAVPGTYHVQINFTDGTTRDETAQKAPDGFALVNLEVQADIREDLQLLKFSTDRLSFSGDDVLFRYSLENIGNQELKPAGDIRIYDRRGQEVASLNVNKDGKTVTPEETAQLASAWSAVNSFGQFKAIITVNYGKGQTASVQDTVFFWIIPWKQLVGLFTAALIAMVVLALYFRQWFEERHLNKLAIAGLLKTHPAAAAAAYIPPFRTPPTPPQKKAPMPPKETAHEESRERMMVRVAENIVIAWRLFTTFKQRGRLTPHDIANERALAQPQKPAKEALPVPAVSHSAPGVAAQWHSWRHDENGHGETIDLKKMRPQARAQAVHEGHTVNLKKHS